MKTLLTALLLSAAPPQIVPVPPPEAPKVEELKASVGEQVQLRIAKKSLWFLVTPGGQLRTPNNAAESEVATFTTLLPGGYIVAAVSADGLALLKVTVGGPPAPPPVDKLAERLKAAFDADGGTKDAALAMTALYRQAATITKNKEAVVSTRQLRDKVREASVAMLADFPAGTLDKLRLEVAKELAAVLGELSEAPMAAETREAAVRLFERLGSILETF
jgi:hypothetical protein